MPQVYNLILTLRTRPPVEVIPNMKKRMLSAAGLLLAGGLFVGCASAPTQELESARATLTAADQAEADVYVSDLYRAAQDSLTAAQAEIEAQNGKFALSRDYDHAQSLLQFVNQTATSATEQVAERKEMMRGEAETLIAQAQEALARAQELLAKAPTGKEGRMALASITEDTGNAQTTLNDAITALQNDDVAGAHSMAQSALDKANMLVQELQSAISKTTQS
jgi:hypothetical protein